jgi:hypothetical protein
MTGLNFDTGNSTPRIQYRQLADAITAAGKKDGNEAIVQEKDKNGQTVFVLQPVNDNDVQNYGTSELNPNIVKFSIDVNPGKKDNAERVLHANTLATRNSLEKALKTMLPPALAERPETKHILATSMGFKDYDSMYNQIAQLPPDKQQQFIAILTNSERWQTAAQNLAKGLSQGGEFQFPAIFGSMAKEFQSVASGMRAELNGLLKGQIDELFAGKGAPKLTPPLTDSAEGSVWSPAALMGIHNSLNNIKNESPRDFQRLQNTNPTLTFKHDTNPAPSSSGNIALQDPVSLLTDSMKIAHTSCADCKDHTITVREGAVQGSADSILDTQILEKIDLFGRTNNSSFPDRAAFERAGFKGGVNHWYTLSEMKSRELVKGDPPEVDCDKARELLAKMNESGDPKQKTWRLLIAMGNSMGTFQPTQLRQHPILKEYLKPGSAGLDMEKLWSVFFPNGNSAKISQIQGALDGLMTNVSPQVLANTVFKMEQMKQVEGLQNFLNEIKPGLAKDLHKDGTIGPRTGVALKRLEAIMALNALKQNMPQPITPQQNRKITEILSAITSEPLSNEKLQSAQSEMKLLMQGIPDRIVQESPRKTLQQTLSRLIDKVDGKIDTDTTKDLVNSWLKIVDTKGEGNIIEDLVTHEVGHNLMEIFKKEHPNIDVARDWAAISGRADSTGPETFTMAPTTASYFTQGQEEVSKYGETSPNEDFAESYRLFMSNPEELYAKAPTKFLILNALSGRFSEAEVKERFGIDAPEKLTQAWQKITGQAGSQFHLSAPMLEQLHKTYPELAAARGKPDASMTTAQVGAAMGPPVPSPLPATKPESLLSPQRLIALAQLSSPPLSKEQLNAAHQAVLKLVQHVQSGGPALSKENIQTLLGADFDKLPGAFKAMLDKPDSTLMQYLNNPNHFSRQNAVTWLQSEVLNQIIGGHEKANSTASTFKNLLGMCTRAAKNAQNMPNIPPQRLKAFYDAALAHVKAQMALMSPPPPVKSDQEMIAIFENALRNMSTGSDKAEKYQNDLKAALGLA